MAYDLVIRNGTVIDGTGGARHQADVAVSGDRIAEIGKISEKGTKEIDTEGHVVTPGFIDGHTHMDAQVFWDSIGSCSNYHGVTSVVMGNCGFTLAPSKPDEHELVISNLERAEDIPRSAMAAGINWTWESYPEYLDAVEAAPKAINYASQIGLSALRTYAMSQRAFEEPANADDLALMERTLREAMRAGAVGFSTSMSDHHLTMDGRPVASCLATPDEVATLVRVLQDEGGIFQLALGTEATESDDPSEAMAFWDWLNALAIETKVPMTYGLQRKNLKHQLDMFDEIAAAGGEMFGQSRAGQFSRVFSFKSMMPYDKMPVWKEFRALSLEEQMKGLHDPDLRKKLVDVVNAAKEAGERTAVMSTQMGPDLMPAYETLDVLVDNQPTKSLAQVAKERGVDPIEAIFDMAVETNFEQVLGRLSGWPEEAMKMALEHPRTVMTFSDAGAHVGYHSGAELQTMLLTDWVRDRQEFTLEDGVRMLTNVPAKYWRMSDRGVLKVGNVADINVFNPDTVGLRAPTVEHDLPGGTLRVKQKATGFLSTVVSGKETLRKGEPTGETPGKLIRGFGK